MMQHTSIWKFTAIAVLAILLFWLAAEKTLAESQDKDCFTIEQAIEGITKYAATKDFSVSVYHNKEPGKWFAHSLIWFSGKQTENRSTAIAHFFTEQRCLIRLPDGKWGRVVSSNTALVKAVKHSALVYQRHGQVY